MPRVRLVTLAEPHLEPFRAMLDDPEVKRFTRFPSPVPDGFEREWFNRYQQGRRDGTGEAFAVVSDPGELFLGVALAPVVNAETRTIELGYVVAPESRGCGVATSALLALSDWAFRELAALRLELLISVQNHASKRVAHRAGCVHEGTLRSIHIRPGVREDVELWSRLPTD